jgi:hypothetical protein
VVEHAPANFVKDRPKPHATHVFQGVFTEAQLLRCLGGVEEVRSALAHPVYSLARDEDACDTMGKVGKVGEGDSAEAVRLPPASGEQFAILAITELLAAEDGVANASPEELYGTKLAFVGAFCVIEQGGDLAMAHADLPGIQCEQRVA